MYASLLCMVLTAYSLITAQVQATVQQTTDNVYAGCKNVNSSWFPECWVSAHARVSFGNDRVTYWTPYYSRRWGNSLSPYWQARALALLAGQGFNSFVGFQTDAWLRYLPNTVPVTTCPDLPKFQEACDLCDSDSWEYAHRCHGAWLFIRPIIVNGTHTAMTRWMRANNVTAPAFQPGDTVIQSRCSRDTLLKHEEFGPVGFSFYKHIKPTAKNIYIVADPKATWPLCLAIRKAKVKWLTAKFPASKVHVVGGSLHDDFAQLLFAPVLFKDAQSSFGLWAALANTGEVWSVPMLKKYTDRTTPGLGKAWHWVDAPVLYPHVAKEANVGAKDEAAIIKWLKEH